MPSAAAARTWFRGGPGHAGPTAVEGPASEPQLRWSAELGTVIFATPRIVATEGRSLVWVGTHGGRFVAVDLADGTIVHELQLGGRIWASAAVAEDGTVYVGSDADTLHAIGPDGKERWQVKLGNCKATRAPGPEGARCDVDGGPTIGPDGDLYVGADGVYRLSPQGEVRWHYPADEDKPRHVFSSPVVDDQGRVHFGGQDGYVTALEADGTERWRYKVLADVDGSPALGEDGALFVGADDGRVYALRSDGSLRWSFVAQRDIRSSIALGPGDRVYFTSFDGNLYAVDPAGEVDWVLGTAAPIHASPVVDAAGRIYFGGQDDHLYGISPEGEVLWRVDVGADVDSSVAIAADGTLVVGADDGILRAYASPAPPE